MKSLIGPRNSLHFSLPSLCKYQSPPVPCWRRVHRPRFLQGPLRSKSRDISLTRNGRSLTIQSPPQINHALNLYNGPSTGKLNATNLGRVPLAIPKLHRYIQSKYNFERRAVGLKSERILGAKEWLDAWQRKWDILEKQKRSSKM